MRPRRAGMTLIEMMIVVIIVAVAATGLSVGFGALNRTHLRSACMRIAAGSRFAYNRAISQGTTVRLAFDLDTEQMSFEEAHGAVTLARIDDERRGNVEDDSEGADAAGVDPWEAARARLADTLRPSFGASPFTTLTGSRYAAAELSDGIAIDRLITPHEADPREDGVGHIYFFPNGQTEHAVVWVTDNHDRVFSIEIHPLTGRGRIREGSYEPEELMVDGDEETSEVRE